VTRQPAAAQSVQVRKFPTDVGCVRARPVLPEIDGDWRAALGARLAMDRPGNQGRRERTGGPYPAAAPVSSAR
jgi:hypothetical protein